MAVDQLLMQQVKQRPLLRIYEWSEPTVTFGYFLPLSDALEAFPPTDSTAQASEGKSDVYRGDRLNDLTYIRRWTGGGVVDHRIDLTYTLMIPRSHPIAVSRGAESYRLIHQALEKVFIQLGESARLTVVNEGDGAAACFQNPVAYDLTDADGKKIAGAGQRRSRYGLLHQGSVITSSDVREFSQALISELSDVSFPMTPDESLFESARVLAASQYNSEEWLHKK